MDVESLELADPVLQPARHPPQLGILVADLSKLTLTFTQDPLPLLPIFATPASIGMRVYRARV